MQPSRDITRLIEILAALRHPESGCPWDREQTFETIVPYTIEEAYEIADAVARGSMQDLKEELGDLLLQVVFQSRIAEEMGLFGFGDVVEAITQKMIRRHPHVFGEACELSHEQTEASWTDIKSEERAAKKKPGPEMRGGSGERDGPLPSGLLADVPVTLPGLTRAVKLQARAETAGFDWSNVRLVLEKVREEAREIEAALDSGNHDAVKEEIGDLLFAAANFARHVHADPEAAIRRANTKFERRFCFIEKELARTGRNPGAVALDEMESFWRLAKQFDP
ncbi:MAG: nucleoside triphosphate pyrophosphohydrolase [Beijerinckiaceae bacterium]|nr:nucleoside triphosphate pyrophosphohydrolase [Beijerinckiaceae bacterium]MCI0735226.1 nucleoside triphosphate pyrophosphohydrolase [Beijerinckiaceae bacterium]